MLAAATDLEGHPDNVAASIYGLFVVCGTEAGRPVAARFSDPPKELEAVVAIPAEEVSTERAREAIPAEVPVGDAVANVSAASRLVLGLLSSDLDLVSGGLKGPPPSGAPPQPLPALDGVGRPRRRDGRPGGDHLRAGPTVLVWTTWQDAGKVAEELERRVSGWAQVRRLPFSPLGADYPEL